LSNLQDQGFQVGGGAACVVRYRRSIGPIDPIEALALGPSHPAEDSGRADTELPGNLVERAAAANGGYQVAAALGKAIV